MGGLIVKIANKFGYRLKKPTILMTGIDGAGKSSIIDKLEQKQKQNCIPTFSQTFNMTQLDSMTIFEFDMGFQERYQNQYQNYFSYQEGIIFVLDSSDIKRYQYAKQQLQMLMKYFDNRTVPLLIINNKSDLKNISQLEVIDILDLKNIPNITQYHIIQYSIFESINLILDDGINWILTTVLNK